MLPETSPPAAEILPSVTVKVELAVGSQLPLLVTMVTCQSPSYGVWAKAGAAAAPATADARNTVAMRLRRMNKTPGVCDFLGYLGTMWPKFDASQQPKYSFDFNHLAVRMRTQGTGNLPPWG